jgi:hypothetical protein
MALKLHCLMFARKISEHRGKINLTELCLHDINGEDSMRFVVATLPDLKFSLGRDLDLAKACVLFGDETILFSPTFTGVEPFLDFSKRAVLHQLLYLAAIERDPGFTVGENLTVEQRAERIRRAKERSDKTVHKALAVIELLKDDTDLKSVEAELERIAREIAPLASGVQDVFARDRECILRARELRNAEKMGLVKIQQFSDSPLPYYNQTKMISDIGDELSRADSYGALDERFLGDFGGLGNGASQKLKAAILSQDIFQTLPGFSAATFDEIHDIRCELTPYLAPFRKAIVEISGRIRSASWDKDFPHEVERELQLRVYPAIAEIERQAKRNSFLRELAYRVAKNPLVIPASSAFGMLLSAASNIPTALASGLAGVGLLASDAHREWKERRQKAEGNEFFFYYRAGAMLRSQRRMKKLMAARR